MQWVWLWCLILPRSDHCNQDFYARAFALPWHLLLECDLVAPTHLHLEEHLDLVLVVSLGLAGYLLRYFKDEIFIQYFSWLGGIFAPGRNWEGSYSGSAHNQDRNITFLSSFNINWNYWLIYYWASSKLFQTLIFSQFQVTAICCHSPNFW